MILRISYLKNQKDTAEMFPPASEDPIPDKYLTSSSFKIHSFPVPLFKQFYSCNFPISQKMLRAFFWPSNLFSDIKARERIFGPKFSFFVFLQKIIMTAYHKQVGEFSSCISSTFVGESDSSIIFPGEQNGILARFNICDALRYLVPFAQF